MGHVQHGCCAQIPRCPLLSRLPGPVQSQVIGTAYHLEIARLVVEWIAVEVVDNLVGAKFTLKQFLDDDSHPSDGPAIYREEPATLIQPARAGWSSGEVVTVEKAVWLAASPDLGLVAAVAFALLCRVLHRVLCAGSAAISGTPFIL